MQPHPIPMCPHEENRGVRCHRMFGEDSFGVAKWNVGKDVCLTQRFFAHTNVL
ncbi:hypothetical protein RISK_001443 [Rhodopirellula islandica]|uniref:Uncharacterized protein n=1 Tax=Rhodopirellula islandica TaxID=595434 RepID=A0A0J1BI66_RHOIS|nr:hypothetical protein RISK_001443 [Rhodopirellula islandica]